MSEGKQVEKNRLRKTKRFLIEGSFLSHVGKFIARVLSTKNILFRIRRKCDFIIGFVIRNIVYRRGDIQENKVFVMTFDSSFSCNARYIAEEILRRHLPVEIIWVVPSKGKIPKESFPEGIKLVRRESYEMYEEQATAKLWIDNALNCVWYGMPKKEGQIYINTWHGSMGIKRLSGNKVWLHRAKRCNKKTDYCITNSTFEENVFHDTFWASVPCLKYGHARNDILFQSENNHTLREKVLQYLYSQPISNGDEMSFGGKEEKLENLKLFLYAPTFRDRGYTDFDELDYKRLKLALEKRFGGEWVILIRAHFKDRARKASIREAAWCKDVSDYADIQELLAVVDAGMTDYSSWAYDYVLTERPLFLFAPDLDDYDQSRGFYYPLESTPFPLARDNDTLEKEVLLFDETVYKEKVDKFLLEKGCYEDGHASERIVDKIEELMGIEKVEK